MIGGEILFEFPAVSGDYLGPKITNSTFSHSAGNGVRFSCNVGHRGCLTTDYTDPSLSNTFSGFSMYPAENPLTCPPQ
jgi:hypothetical protein